MPSWQELAAAQAGEDYAHRFADHFDQLEAAGQDVHGEASFVASLVPPGATVLDAGCGTGRVAARLATLGYAVEGVDLDEKMIEVARERSPSISWSVSGLAELDLGTTYDVVVLAGNVIPFVDPSTLPAVAARLRDHTRPGGLVVCGYGLDLEHLPPGAPVVPLDAYDEACTTVGLVLAERFGGWAREEFVRGGGYAVSVHRRD